MERPLKRQRTSKTNVHPPKDVASSPTPSPIDATLIQHGPEGVKHAYDKTMRALYYNNSLSSCHRLLVYLALFSAMTRVWLIEDSYNSTDDSTDDSIDSRKNEAFDFDSALNRLSKKLDHDGIFIGLSELVACVKESLEESDEEDGDDDEEE